jgi:type 1 fimbriae regulatory protein FimB/type 1 fimbriae regulatory protein FimE
VTEQGVEEAFRFPQSLLVHVSRLKNGLASSHPIRGPELRALRELRRDYPDSPYLFVTERGGPMTPATARNSLSQRHDSRVCAR